jgi:DNA-binding SARP family transcriptional activator/tetratricopeptide (TPR) repeat protein
MGGGFFLRCMGYPGLYGADGRPYKLKVRKHLALLVYLALEDHAQRRRDTLVELLWSGAAPECGRHSLSMALSVLRGVLGAGAIRATSAHVRLERGAVTLDLEQVERGEVLGDAVTPPLEVDGFLADFDIEDAPGFMHWRDRQQAHLLPMLQAGLLTLADQARRSGDMTRVMALADRLLTLDPLAEEGIRARMEAFAMQGDRVSALRTFEEWKAELHLQLGAAPSELLERMADRLRRRGVELTCGPAGPSVPTEQWADRPFVGRVAEYRALYDSWDSSLQLATQHVLLTGESGIGKSTLALRFATAAALDGAAVARVQCFELEQRIPFGMIGALVTGLLDRPGVIGTAPESLAEIARVVPRVRERFPHLPPPRKTEGEAARLHFAEGVFALFDAIMDEQPLVLIVDDYPRSDEASLSVLHMLLRRAGRERLMVVLSGRPAERGEPAQAARIRKGVAYLPMRHLELGPMAEAECEEILSAVVGTAGKKAAAPERRAILRASSGNPMALELLAQDWVVHGEAALAVSLPAMSPDPPGSALQAARYDRLIDRILTEISPRTRVGLHLAAVLGPRLNDLDYFRIVDLSGAQTMAALSELVSYRVLRDVGGRLEFVNELVRGRIYLRIPSPSRHRLHHSVAERLLAAVAAGETLPGLEVAWHCIRARRPEEGTPFLMRGAREAITHGAPDEAARALATGVRHLKGRARDEALLLLAETYQEMAEWKGALECIEGLSRDGMREPAIRELAEVMEIECQRQCGRFTADELPGLVRDLVCRARLGTTLPARVKAVLSAAILAGVLREEAFYPQVREVIEEVGGLRLHTSQRGILHLAKAFTYYHARENGNGLNDLHTALEQLTLEERADSTVAQIYAGLGAMSCSAGRYDDAMIHLELAYRVASRLDHAPLMGTAASNLAMCCSRLGFQNEHRSWALSAWKLMKNDAQGGYSRIQCAAECCFSAIPLHNPSELTTALTWLDRSIAEAILPWARQAGYLFRADAAWLAGDKQAAFEAAIRAQRISRRPLSVAFAGPLARWTTILCLRDDKPKDALELLGSLEGQLARLDALDRAEVLGCVALLQERIPVPVSAAAEMARQELARLPAGCATRLASLGLALPD